MKLGTRQADRYGKSASSVRGVQNTKAGGHPTGPPSGGQPRQGRTKAEVLRPLGRNQIIKVTHGERDVAHVKSAQAGSVKTGQSASVNRDTQKRSAGFFDGNVGEPGITGTGSKLQGKKTAARIQNRGAGKRFPGDVNH